MTAWREPYQTKKGIKWRVRWRDAGKKRTKKAGFLKSTATKLIEKVEDDLVQDRPIGNAYRVRDCYGAYVRVIQKTVKPRTALIAQECLKSFLEKFAGAQVKSIKSEDIETFKNQLLEIRNSNGTNIVIRNIKTFFQFCVRSGYLERNPAQSIKQFKTQPVARFLTRGELTVFYRASSRELRRATYVLYNTGMRLGEFLGVSDQDILRNGVRVSGKTGARIIPLRPGPRRILCKIIGEWNLNKFRSAWVRAARKANIGRVRPHDLRHTFASAYLKSGGTLADLRIIGGWQSLAMLQTYTHFQEDYLAERMIRMRL